MARHNGLLGMQNDISNRGELLAFLLFFRVILFCIYFMGSLILHTFFTQAVAEMAAIGFGLPKDSFTSLMKQVNNV